MEHQRRPRKWIQKRRGGVNFIGVEHLDGIGIVDVNQSPKPAVHEYVFVPIDCINHAFERSCVVDFLDTPEVNVEVLDDGLHPLDGGISVLRKPLDVPRGDVERVGQAKLQIVEGLRLGANAPRRRKEARSKWRNGMEQSLNASHLH